MPETEQSWNEIVHLRAIFTSPFVHKNNINSHNGQNMLKHFAHTKTIRKEQNSTILFQTFYNR